jgi:hypothetical protein
VRHWRVARSRGLDRASETGTPSQPRGGGSPASPWAGRLADAAARALPAAGRARYREEFRSELQEIAAAGQPRRRQVGCALRQMRSALPMRAELAARRRPGSWARPVAAVGSAAFVAVVSGFALTELPQVISPDAMSAAGPAYAGSPWHASIVGGMQRAAGLAAMSSGLTADRCRGGEAPRVGRPAPTILICLMVAGPGAASPGQVPASRSPAPAASPGGAPVRPGAAP